MTDYCHNNYNVYNFSINRVQAMGCVMAGRERERERELTGFDFRHFSILISCIKYQANPPANNKFSYKNEKNV